MKKKLVFAGGGHAHMVSLANLHVFVKKGFSVTVIGPSEYHYYSGMGPGMLGRIYKPEEIRFATRQVVEKKGGNFRPRLFRMRFRLSFVCINPLALYQEIEDLKAGIQGLRKNTDDGKIEDTFDSSTQRKGRAHLAPDLHFVCQKALYLCDANLLSMKNAGSQR